MLKKAKYQKDYKNILLVGSTSEIGISIINKLDFKESALIVLAGRENPSDDKFRNQFIRREFWNYDFEVEEDLDRFKVGLSVLDNIDLAIIAIGFLPPENGELDFEMIKKTFKLNALAAILVLSILVKKMRSQSAGQILLISSVASMRPRLRNFVYGSTKECADFFSIGMSHKYKSNLHISILRPGFVFTKMSKQFKPSPFAIHPTGVARITIEGLASKKRIIYAPRKLRYLMPLLSMIPRVIYNRMG
jgi:decaprenylphospho-beta-D-erythro-pentofuranosid-2-ulose 2-reductase